MNTTATSQGTLTFEFTRSPPVVVWHLQPAVAIGSACCWIFLLSALCGDSQILQPILPRQLTYREHLRLFTPRTSFLAGYLSLAALNFGYDVGVFSGIQAMATFRRRFGEFNEATGKWVLPSYLQSLMNSLPIFGKLVGALACGKVTEKWGRRKAMFVLALISVVGVTLQTAAHSAAQFIVGRIINFAMTGFVIVLTPIYQAECFPAPIRGMVNSTLQFQIVFGALLSTFANLGAQRMTTDAAWLIPTGLQLIVPAIIIAFLPIMPESPRWLIAKGKNEEAIKNLKLLRKKDTPDNAIAAEIRVLSSFDSNYGKGPWKEVFSLANRRRTWIAIAAMFFQQVTGQAFVSQYSVVFYQQQGVSQRFLVACINATFVLACCVLCSNVVDSMGRRPFLLTGGTVMAFFIFLVGGIGTIDHPSPHLRNLLVASMMLFGGGYNISWAPVSYVVLGEAAASRVKEKTSQLAIVISVITTFVVSFPVPYLVNAAHANLGAKVGFIYGSMCVLSVICAFLLIPGMRGRSLEELDELFAAKVPAWRSKGFHASIPSAGLGERELGGIGSVGKIEASSTMKEVTVSDASSNHQKRGEQV